MPKKYTLFFSLLFVLSFLFFGYSYFKTEKVVNYPPKGEVVVAFGDSLVEGVGSTEGNDFVSLVSVNVGIPIRNFGHAGDTTRDGLLKLPRVLDENPDMVLLLLGGNDYLKKIPKEETFKNLEIIIQTLEDHGALVVLLGVRGGIFGDHFAEGYEILQKKYHTAYVSNVLEGIFFDTTLKSDEIHPNDKGYAVIAARVTEELKKVLPPKNPSFED
ncbi:MAG: GDSL-type esterase/lipase family protein [Patescibacteria group bacterium]